MKLETLLDAMEHAFERVDWISPTETKFERQYHAFRARILCMDAEKDEQIKELLEISTKEGLARLEEDDDSNNN